MLSRFFINRPIFASVLSIIVTLAGLVALWTLPVAQYPEIAPPTVLITTTYPGASAETLAKTVAAPIEEQLSGVEGLLYYQSSASSNGTLTITATFDVGTDINNATIQVNNRVQIALPRLPDDVRRTGVLVQKRSIDILLVVGVTSNDPRYDTLFLSNYMLNDRFTFGTRRPSFRRLAKFNITSLAGLGVNVMIVWILTRHGVYFLAANLVGIAVAVVVNYTFSVAWVWRREA